MKRHRGSARRRSERSWQARWQLELAPLESHTQSAQHECSALCTARVQRVSGVAHLSKKACHSIVWPSRTSTASGWGKGPDSTIPFSKHSVKASLASSHRLTTALSGAAPAAPCLISTPQPMRCSCHVYGCSLTCNAHEAQCSTRGGSTHASQCSNTQRRAQEWYTRKEHIDSATQHTHAHAHTAQRAQTLVHRVESAWCSDALV